VSSVDLHVAPRVEPQRKQTERRYIFVVCFHNVEYTEVGTVHIIVSDMSSSLTNLDQLSTSAISLWILFHFFLLLGLIMLIHVSSVDLHVAPRVEPQRKQTERRYIFVVCCKKKEF
jgi:hypothetical protein